jgi:hypothetical protein
MYEQGGHASFDGNAMSFPGCLTLSPLPRTLRVL